MEVKIMWNKPTSEELSKIQGLYSAEQIPLKEKVIYMHFFLGGCDWYASEYEPEERLFFGFAILNNDLEMAEWGYFSLEELSSIKIKFLEIDRDLHFTPTKAIDIENIRIAQNWKKGESHECEAKK